MSIPFGGVAPITRLIGTSHIYLNFDDGKTIDLVEEARLVEDPRISEKSGQ